MHPLNTGVLLFMAIGVVGGGYILYLFSFFVVYDLMLYPFSWYIDVLV